MTDVKTLKPLSPKHQLFLDNYLVLWNQTKAYQVVYPGTSDSVARAAGSRLFANDNVRAHYQAALEQLHMTADEALQRLADMGRSDISDFVDVSTDENGMPDGWDVNLFEIEDGKIVVKKQSKNIRKLKKRTFTDKFGQETVQVEVELYDKQEALEKVLRMHGRFSDTKPEIIPPSLGALASLPADVVAPDFLNLYRDVKAGLHTEYLIEGGRGSTKSTMISLLMVWLIVNNPNVHGVALRQVADTLRSSVYEQIKWSINLLGLSDSFKCTVSPMEIEYFPTHQKIYFRGADDPGKLKSIKPPFGYIGFLWLEELDQYHGVEAVRKIEQSVIRGGDKAFIFKSFNPPRTASNWANKYKQVPKANQFQHHSTYLNVPVEWLGKPFIEEAEHLRTVNPAAYEHEYLGIANSAGGRVFENVVIRAITDDEIAQFDHVLHGLDWGFYPDPLSYGKMHYDAARRILYIFGEFRGHKLSNRAAYDALVERGLQPSDLIIADSAEPKSVADFRDYGASIRGAEKGPDSVDYSIKWLQGLTQIVIDNQRAPYHAEEFLDYELEQDKDGEFISQYPDKNNHAIDDTRYATNLIWRKRGM